MNRRSLLRLSVVALCLLRHCLLTDGCDRAELNGPPDLRVGRDECGECGMIINEDRCSCAFLIEREGVREHVMFDDIGCMLDFEHQSNEGVRIIDGFVRDHASRAWVPVDTAAFLMADREILKTPMGSGIVAFGTRADAQSLRETVGGEILDYQQLRPARRAWMEARFGKERPAS